jgi:hypothetical protein
MPLSEDNQLPPHGPSEIDASHGYERSDVRVTGIVVFLTALAIFVAVSSVLCYGIGKVINAELNKEDGPDTHWTKSRTVDVRQLGNMPNDPALQNKVAALVQQFPTPRTQSDDGLQDIANLHAREDLLLEHYSRIDGQAGNVRIPIERAMELIAQRGLPVAPPMQTTPIMTGDHTPRVTIPLTDGFVRTAYEMEQLRDEGPHAERPPDQK